MQGVRTRPPLGSSARRDAVTGQPIPPTLGVRLAPFVVFAVSLALYLRTMLPGIAFDDWGEMQMVPHVLGVPHPTGYPTYILARLAVRAAAGRRDRVPRRPVGRRVLAAALAALASRARRGVLRRRPPPRSPPPPRDHLVVGRRGRGQPPPPRVHRTIPDRSAALADGRRLRDLALGGLLIGLSLGNHVLTAFVGPVHVLRDVGRPRDAAPARRWILAPAPTGLRAGGVPLHLIAAGRCRHPPQPANFLQLRPLPRHRPAVPRPVRRPLHAEGPASSPSCLNPPCGCTVLAKATPLSRASAGPALRPGVLRRAFALAGGARSCSRLHLGRLPAPRRMTSPLDAAGDPRRGRPRRIRAGPPGALARLRVGGAAPAVAGAAAGLAVLLAIQPAGVGPGRRHGGDDFRGRPFSPRYHPMRLSSRTGRLRAAGGMPRWSTPAATPRRRRLDIADEGWARARRGSRR